MRRWTYDALQEAQVDEKAMVAAVLDGSGAHDLVRLTLYRPAVATDPELREKAFQRLMSWPAAVELYSSSELEEAVLHFLAAVPPDVRRSYGSAMLEKGRDPLSANGYVLRAALQRIGDFRESGLCDELAIGLQHPDATVRLAAVVQLGRAFSTDAVRPLIVALKDDDHDVRTTAEQNLEKLNQYLVKKQMYEDKFSDVLKKAK